MNISFKTATKVDIFEGKTKKNFQILNLISIFAVKMAGIYIHIPFCKSRCIYCGFYSTTSLEIRQRYVDAVCRELAIRRGSTVSTIYLGGGTPSQLTINQLCQILNAIHKYNKVENDAEITIEANPDDVTPTFAEGLLSLSINRVSMGAQTFDDKRLHWLHRRHTALQVSLAVERLREAGIRNISIDLMYGFPEESIDQWERDISQALMLHPDHLSAYCLMVEEGTVLFEQMKNEKLKMRNDNEELERQMYYTLIERLTAAGYEHYEISNFARPGYRSRHNSSYWDGTPYIGIGAAAHSYDVLTRSWNVSNLKLYIEGMEQGERRFEEERLDDNTRYNDLITVALRTCEGLDLAALSERHRLYCLRSARRFIDNGLLTLHDSHLVLTRNGLFVSDMIMSELMMV